MDQKKIVFISLLIICMTATFANAKTTAKITDKQPISINSNQSITVTGAKLQFFANTRYISQGDIITITYDVYTANYSLIPGIVITFVFGTNYFTKTSGSTLATFTIKVNQTYSQVTLLGQIDTDQEQLTFYNSNQKPVCISSCLAIDMNATQLQLFQDFQTTYSITLTTITQFFYATDVLEVKIPSLNTLVYSNETSITYINNNIGYQLQKTIQISVPLINPGIYTLTFSFYSTQYVPISINKSVTIASSAMGVTLTNNSVDRLNIGEGPKDYVTYQLGFDITNMNYRYFIANNQSVVYSVTSLVLNNIIKLPITIAYYCPVGNYYLNLEIQQNGLILYTKVIPILVYDNIITNVQYNNELTDNQLSVSLIFNTYIEDLLLNYPTTVFVYNNKTNQLLYSSGIYSTKTFTLTFPNQTSIPNWLRVETITNSSFYKGSVSYYPLYYRAETSITSNFVNPIQVERLQNINIRIQVNNTKTNQSIIIGLVDMAIDGEKRAEIDLQNTNQFNYNVPVESSVGKHSLTLNYLGTDTLRPTSISYDYYIYSNVHFANVNVNNTFTNPTTPILVQGTVEDENGNGVITKTDIVDSNGTVLEQTVTNSDGSFSFIILNTDIMGYYNYYLQAETANYYKSAQYEFNLLQNNKFNVSIIANQTMGIGSITIRGDVYGEYSLTYYTNPDHNFNIQVLDLDNNGEKTATFITPNIIGSVYFNVTNVKNPEQTWIQKYILYKTPNVTIVQLNDAYVGGVVNISINSDVYYSLLFNDKVIADQNIYINKTIISLSVDTRGINTIKLEFQSNYITIREIIREIFVYEQIHLSENLPQKVNENTNITVNVQVLNLQEVPIGGLQLEFLYLNTVVFNKTMDAEGSLQVYISLNDDLNKYTFRILGSKNQYVQEQDFKINTILIRSLVVTSDIQAKEFNNLIPTTVTFQVTYKNTGLAAPLVNMTIQILEADQVTETDHVQTGNNGAFTLTIAKPVGTYVIMMLVNDLNYAMAKAIYTIDVKGFDVVNNPFVLPALLVSIGGILVMMRKKALT